MRWIQFRNILQAKWLFLALVLSACLVAGWLAVMERVSQTLTARQAEISTLLEEQIGLPVGFSSLQTEWSGFSFLITLHDLVIQDEKTNAPFLSVNKLTLRSSLFRLLLKSSIPFREIVLDGLKLRLQWTEQYSVRVLGLKGETLPPSSMQYKNVLQALASQERIALKDSEIHWQGPHTRILQKLEGVLCWQDVQSLAWEFIGKQQIKLNEGDFLPAAKLSLKMESALNQLKMQFDMMGMQITGQITALDAQPRLACRLDIKNTPLEPFHHNLVLKPQDADWIRWLVGALEKGTVTRGQVEIEGLVEHLNWRGELAFKQVDLQYAEGWPKIENAKGRVSFSNDKVEVKLSKGSILGASLDVAQAVISPLTGQASPEVLVEGALKESLEKGLKFLQTSPLKASIGERLASLHPKGSMELQLNLRLPLDDQKPATVQGQIKVRKAQLSLAQIDADVTELNGHFNFTEKGVTSEGIQGNWLDQPVTFEVTPSLVKTELLISSDYLREQFETDYLNYLKGSATFNIQYNIDKEEWNLSSNLKGMEIDLPPPLTKAADSEREMHFTLYSPSSLKEQRYALTLKGELDAKWVLETRQAQPVFKRGHIMLGGAKADWVTQNALIIAGELPHLDIDVWRTFLSKLETAPQSLPIHLTLLAHDIEGFGLNFKNTGISLNYKKGKSEWKLNGPTIKGSIILPSKKSDKMQLDFDHLKLNRQEIKEQKDNEFFKGSERFAVQFFSKHVQVDDTIYGEVGFGLEPKPYGYEIQNVRIRTPDSLLEANGLWRLETAKNEEMSFLQGSLSTDNISHTFTQWGFSTSMREGRGHIHFNLNWPGSPFQLNLKSAQGGARLKLRNGRILGVDPGLGKILGLLSLESIARRLQLDFRDVVQKGFVFEALEATLLFKESYAKTDNLKLSGPAADILINGNANLVTKMLDLQMQVIPKMSNTLPLAAGIATGNLAIGAGVWVLDKLTGSRISQAVKRYYHVTGTWDAPAIHEIHSSKPSVSGHRRTGSSTQR